MATLQDYDGLLLAFNNKFLLNLIGEKYKPSKKKPAVKKTTTAPKKTPTPIPESGEETEDLDQTLKDKVVETDEDN